MMLQNVAIVDALRTPIGRGGKGTLNAVRPDDLGALVVSELVRRTRINPQKIEDVIVGCAMPEGEQGMNVARIISLRAGLPFNVAAATVNRFCASGLEAVAQVAKSIAVGEIKAGIGGGVESMSMVPMGGNKPSANPYLMEHMPTAYTSMGMTAENVAAQFGIDRKAQDDYSLESHHRAIMAWEKGCFQKEIVTVPVDEKITFSKDEGPRADTTIEALNALRPVFKNNGSVTAGNSSQVSDGAAAVLLMNADDAKAEGQNIRAYFRAFVTKGVDPDIMGIGPVPAIQKLCATTGIELKDIGVFEINEAFAAQVLYCLRELKLDRSKVNPNGGAIALGHPLGCTGARQIATIVNHMERNGLKYGITSMCVGGGMGAASLIELA